ncbi:Non-specific lipid-transfer protein 3 [Linum perenne]
MAAAMKLISLFLVLALVSAPMTVTALTCGQVTSGLAPCVGYLRGSGPPTPGCCNGMKGLLAAARTTADRRQACNCLKSAAGNVPGLNPALVEPVACCRTPRKVRSQHSLQDQHLHQLQLVRTIFLLILS